MVSYTAAQDRIDRSNEKGKVNRIKNFSIRKLILFFKIIVFVFNEEKKSNILRLSVSEFSSLLEILFFSCVYEIAE